MIALPPGLAWRPATMGDAEAVAELVAACEIAAHGEADIDVEDLSSDWRRPGIVLSRDSVMVFRGEALVAYADVMSSRYLDGHVHPGARGHGIGAALLRWAERRVREQGGTVIGQTATDADATARDLFLANGFEPCWTSWALEIRLETPPPAPELPSGLAIRPVGPDRDARPVHALIEEAFGEWKSRPPTPFEDWAAWSFGREGFEPWWMPLVVDADQIVGVAYLIPYPDDGWVQQLAVKGTHRQRGIGRALLQHSFREFLARGRRVVGLSTDSRTGAIGLYEHVGMRVKRSYTHFAKRL